MSRWLAVLAWIVPDAERDSWRREWEGEVAYHARSQTSGAVRRRWTLRRAWAAWQHACWLRWQTMSTESLWQDLKHGARALARRPGFTVAATLTLALGIGGTSVIVSAMRAVFWRPLPYPAAHELAMVSSTDRSAPQGVFANSVSPPDFSDWRAQAASFTGVAAIRDDGYALVGGSVAEQITGNAVTGDFFNIFGIPAARGRYLTQTDAASAAPVVVLSHGLWTRRFGADPAIVGQSIVLEGLTREVVGVMPASFNYPLGAEVWTPLRFSAEELTTQRGAHYLTVVARLRSGVTVSAAASEMAGVAARLSTAFPTSNRDAMIAVAPLRDGVVGAAIVPGMRLLLGAVGLVFLIACVNVSSLVLGQALRRRRDLSLRTALGASRARLMQGMLVESLLLAAAGGIVGIAIAAFGVRVIAGLDTTGIALLDETRLDPVVVAFTIVVTMAAAVAFGLLPAWQASRGVSSGLASASARTTEDRGRSRLRGAMVAVEIAFAAALLIGAGLLARSFVSLSRVDLGIDVHGVQTMTISLPTESYPQGDRRVQFTDDLLTRLRARGDVTAAAVVFGLPLTDFSYHFSIFEKDGRKPDASDRTSVELRVVSPEFFAAMGIPVKSGRAFSDSDRRATSPVVIVNGAAARALWPEAAAVGHSVRLPTRLVKGGDRVGGDVIGVVGDVRDRGPAFGPRPTVYLAQAQVPLEYLTIVVKATGVAGDLVPWMRDAVAATDPTVPVFRVRTMAEFASAVKAQPRLYVALLGLFAVAAIGLAAVGIYGVMAQNVGARTREIGVRMALGATRREVVAMVIGNAGRMALLGLAAGMAIAMVARPAIANLLFGVQAIDALTYGVVAVGTLLVAFAAAWLPARRAASIDPIVVLRTE